MRVDARDLASRWPVLSSSVTAGLLCPADRFVDPDSLVDALARATRDAGVDIRENATVTAVEPAREGIRITTHDGVLHVGHLVVAAGTGSPDIVRRAGLGTLPVRPGKGYVLDLPPSRAVDRALYLSEAKIAVTPLDERLRLAGIMEFGARDLEVTKRRVASILRGAQRYFADELDAPVHVSAGARPMTVDGLPIIGRLTRDGRVLVATGHGMLGVTLAPLTAELVLADIAGRPAVPDASAFSPRRFRRS